MDFRTFSRAVRYHLAIFLRLAARLLNAFGGFTPTSLQAYSNEGFVCSVNLLAFVVPLVTR